MPISIGVATRPTGTNSARPDPPGRIAKQMDPPGRTAGKMAKTEVKASDVFKEAASAAGTFRLGSRGRAGHAQTSDRPLPQGFKNVKSSDEAIKYVQSLSKVATSRPSHVYSQIARNDDGKLVGKNAQGKQTFLRPDATLNQEMLKEYRNEGRKNAIDQIGIEAQKGLPLNDHEQYASLMRHANAALLQRTETMGPDEVTANCAEKAMMAFDMLANKEDNPQLDVVGLANTEGVTAFAAITGELVDLPIGPDHAFLIIGRDPQSDIADPNTWGDDTVICDPWSQRTFAVSSFKEEMELLSSTTNGKTRCEARISWPADTPYDSDPAVVYREQDGIGTETPRDLDYEKNARTTL